MNQQLAEALIERGIIGLDTEFVAKYMGKGLDGASNQFTTDIFVLKGYVRKEDKLYMCALKKDNEQLHRLPCGNIVEIDGMVPERLAGIFNIKPDGSARRVKLDEFGNPIRPGRKPKHIKEQMEKAKKAKQ